MQKYKDAGHSERAKRTALQITTLMYIGIEWSVVAVYYIGLSSTHAL